MNSCFLIVCVSCFLNKIKLYLLKLFSFANFNLLILRPCWPEKNTGKILFNVFYAAIHILNGRDENLSQHSRSFS
jgi:hypothetical protein